MSIYLPIAERSVDIWTLLAVGGGVGLLSGIFGVGGGFLMTPLLMFLGISPAVAVATGANQILGTGVSGAIAHWRRRNVDLRMGAILLAGGLGGAAFGVWLFAWLQRLGQIDLVISLCYLVFLTGVGTLMLAESLRAALAPRRGGVVRRRHRPWHGWPLRLRFPRSGLYGSVLPPLGVGVLGGILAVMMGGGGFVLVPLMIYVLGMPTAVVVGTSLFQLVFVTAGITVMQALTTHTVDLVLALILLVGGAVGAQLGARLGRRLRGDHLRILLALVVLSVAAKMAWDLFSVPGEVFSLAN